MAAVDRLGRAERKALLSHCSTCASCQAALVELEGTVRVLPLVNLRQLTDSGIARKPVQSGGVPRHIGESWGQRLRLRLLVPAVAAVAAAAVAAALFLGVGHPLQVTVGLHGATGVHASAVLSPTSSGTEVGLHTTGQSNGQVFTVSMESRSGYWWQAGSYRAIGGRTDVNLSCAAITSSIDRILVRNSKGGIVLQAKI